MTFNEFQRELQRRNISPENAYMMTLIYERLGHIMNEHEELAKVCVTLANHIQGFVQLNESMNKKLVALATGKYHTEGVDVQSVANDPEDEGSKH